MNILLLGGGGREHALAWKLKQSPRCRRLFISPGNAGVEELGQRLPIDPNDFDAVAAVVLERDIDMVVVGPEEPLVNGIRDYFRAHPKLSDIRLIGPSREGARLEGSKAYAKQFMAEYHIPTAAYREFTAANAEEGRQYLAGAELPIVLKADGLAAGKGVVICQSAEEAQREFDEMLSGKFGAASARVVVEQFLSGIEFSVFALTDGKDYRLLPVAKDYKRVGEGDTGPNTGGMGAVSPPPFVDYMLMRKVETRIVRPTIQGLRARGIDYQGFLFFGLISVQGDPFVIEYNCRLGDPETQVVLPRLKNDLVELFLALSEGRLARTAIEEEERAAAAVILASEGYPGAYQKGKSIEGLESAREGLLFFAGVERRDSVILANGGRVMAVCAYGDNFREALAACYRDVSRIHFEGMYFRSDIGFDL
jgi:phosphoribosylamine--glycine ligase